MQSSISDISTPRSSRSSSELNTSSPPDAPKSSFRNKEIINSNKPEINIADEIGFLKQMILTIAESHDEIKRKFCRQSSTENSEAGEYEPEDGEIPPSEIWIICLQYRTFIERLKLLLSTRLPEPESMRPGTAKELREWCKSRRRAVRSKVKSKANTISSVDDDEETKSNISINSSTNAFHSDEEGKSLDQN